MALMWFQLYKLDEVITSQDMVFRPGFILPSKLFYICLSMLFIIYRTDGHPNLSHWVSMEQQHREEGCVSAGEAAHQAPARSTCELACRRLPLVLFLQN